ncbi:MAG: succinate dehydrogenase, cytochrome b556 subunit [Geminicoccaceae bacterium]|nr:MAG: succinate dehydrogenase, cytochrome b556 subunit [Geminicoccaceae bacterium]
MPLSPHVSIYRWPITMVLSISHRVTGAALAVGLVMLTVWLVAMASGPEAFAVVDGVVRSWFGALVLFGYTAFLFLHMGNGIRHLAWDIGLGFEKDTARRTAMMVIGFAVGATLLTWLVLLLSARG